MEQDTINTALVGGVDEHSPHTLYLYDLVGLDQKGEGASFFALSVEATPNTYGELVDVALYNELTSEQQQTALNNFLSCHHLTLSNIDLILTGEAENRSWQRPTLRYKTLSSEYYTASAFGLWLACQVLQKQTLPAICELTLSTPIQYILLVNSYRGKDFSFVLLKK